MDRFEPNSVRRFLEFFDLLVPSLNFLCFEWSKSCTLILILAT